MPGSVRQLFPVNKPTQVPRRSEDLTALLRGLEKVWYDYLRKASEHFSYPAQEHLFWALVDFPGKE
jgi:hypothetical protein